MGGSDIGKTLKKIGVILFLVPFFIIPLLMIGIITGGISLIMWTPIVVIVAMIGFALIAAGGVISGGSGFLRYPRSGQRIPPVEYPRQAQTQQAQKSVEEIMCPDCGAPPKYVNSYGLCTCEYCGTIYKIR